MSDATWVLRVIYYYKLDSAKQRPKANMTEPLYSNNLIFVFIRYCMLEDKERTNKKNRDGRNAFPQSGRWTQNDGS